MPRGASSHSDRGSPLQTAIYPDVRLVAKVVQLFVSWPPPCQNSIMCQGQDLAFYLTARGV
eukprot:6350719-Pyramimonas_sp.AAC.1